MTTQDSLSTPVGASDSDIFKFTKDLNDLNMVVVDDSCFQLTNINGDTETVPFKRKDNFFHEQSSRELIVYISKVENKKRKLIRN